MKRKRKKAAGTVAFQELSRRRLKYTYQGNEYYLTLPKRGVLSPEIEKMVAKTIELDVVSGTHDGSQIKYKGLLSPKPVSILTNQVSTPVTHIEYLPYKSVLMRDCKPIKSPLNVGNTGQAVKRVNCHRSWVHWGGQKSLAHSEISFAIDDECETRGWNTTKGAVHCIAIVVLLVVNLRFGNNMVKLKMGEQQRWEEHRSGWKFALGCLEVLRDEEGILFDGVIDYTFGYGAAEARKARAIPYKEFWIGFIHSSVTLCPFMSNYTTIDSILESPEFVESLVFCRGLFTLSEYLAEYIRTKLPRAIPVCSLKHPTEFPSVTFDIDRFLASEKVVHIGSWLRRVTSFLSLNAGAYQKILLMNPRTVRSLKEEMLFYKDSDWNFSGLEVWQRLSDQDYDNLLSEAVVFVHLCDSSATNTIIECIVRNTPILVNRSRPVSEYLGDEYPFYYSCLDEATAKLANRDLIRKTHEYLIDFRGKNELSERHFFDNFVNSTIMKDLSAKSN